MSMMDVCHTKRHFDTEFEATINAAKISYKHGEEMEPYKCGTHWHITHVDVTKRRGVGHNYWRCPKCKVILKRKKAAKHKCDIKEEV